MRGHCHETAKQRGPACYICNLKYKQQNFLPVIFRNSSGYDFNLLYSEIFKENNDEKKLDNIPLAAVKSKMFSIVRPKFLDSYDYIAMSLDQIANVFRCKKNIMSN